MKPIYEPLKLEMEDCEFKEHFDDLCSRVVAKSGRPSDRYHFGKLILQGLKDYKDFVLQVNVETGEFDTCGSVLNRSIRCAIALQNLGLTKGDVISIMAPNHLDACVPMYASFYTGILASTPDRMQGPHELEKTFDKLKPKVIFCQADKVLHVKEALKPLDLNTIIVTFDGESENLKDFLRSVDEDAANNFKATDIESEDDTVFLASTSGTTGLSKCAKYTYKNIAIGFSTFWLYHKQFPTPTQRMLIWSALHWVTVISMYIMSPILKFTRLQSPAAALTVDQCFKVINEYKPTYAVLNSSFCTALLNIEQCNLTSFETMILAGSAVNKGLISLIKERAPDIRVRVCYGLTETCGGVFFGGVTEDTCNKWKAMIHLQYKIVNPDTLEDITEPRVVGELWLKGPSTIKEYYNDPQATDEMFAKDNWLKSGDLFYTDEEGFYHFVERYKMLMKYTHNTDIIMISPLELETVIRQHPAVLDVAVSSVPDPELGDLPVACVVVKPDHAVNAQEIKNLVNSNMTEHKQLHGGVLFVKALPLTSTSKVDRMKLKKLVSSSERQ